MLATRLGVGASTVSETVRRLADSGLVTHQPYGAVELTADGERHALAVVRRHRLIETFLVEMLGYGWDEVHDEAEVLEHAVSDLFVERLAARLGHPTRDPHGDPIPGPDGSLDIPAASVLWDVDAGGVGGRADLRRRPRAAAVPGVGRPAARRAGHRGGAPHGRRGDLGAGRRRARSTSARWRRAPSGWSPSADTPYAGRHPPELTTAHSAPRSNRFVRRAPRWSRCRPRARAPRCSPSPSAGSASAPPSSRRWACCPRSPTTSASRSPSPGTPSPRTRSASSSAPRRSRPWAPRLDRRRLLLLLMVAFTVGNVLSAFAPSMGWLVLARFLAGLPHGAFFGVGAVMGTAVVGTRAARAGGRRDDGRPDRRVRRRCPAVDDRRPGRRLAVGVRRGRRARPGHARRACTPGPRRCRRPPGPPSGPSSPPCATGGSGSRSAPARSGSAACSPSTPTSSRCSPT